MVNPYSCPHIFPPQFRLNMYENRKEYIYFIQSDSAQKLYFHFKNHPDLVYIAYCSGNFDIFLQLSAPLDVLPDRTNKNSLSLCNSL
jgi:hypothetical protein